MRAFTLIDNAAIENVFRMYSNTDIITFSTFIIQEVSDRISLFLGDNYSNINDCSFNSLFGELIYKLECIDKSLSISNYEILLGVNIHIPKEFEDKIFISTQKDKVKLVFTETLSHIESLQFIKAQDIENQAYIEQVIYELELKVAFKKIRELTAEYSLKILKTNNLGFIAVPLQIDTRGEILLVPNISEGRVKSTFIRLEHCDDESSNIIKSKNINLKLI